MSDLDKNKESSEENNKQKAKVDLKGKFIKEFSKDILSGGDKNTFLDEVMKKDSIESGSFLEKEINKFQAKNSEFNEFDQKKITIYDLQRQVGKQYSSLEFSRASYLEDTFSKYNLNEKQREKLEKEIKNKSENELNKLINSEIENNKLITKIFGENKIDKISNFNFLDALSENEIQNRINKLSESDKQSVKTSLLNLKNLRAGDIDIQELFSTNFLKKNEKKEILSRYIPYLSLEKAKELGILDNYEAEKKKKGILEPLLKKNGLSGDILDNALKSASLEDIKIKSSDFFSDENNLNIISEGVGFANFEKDLKDVKKGVLDDLEKNGPQSLEELKQLLSSEEFNGDFENLDNFKEGNIVKIITKTKEGGEEISYGKIQSISDLNKKINIKWVGDNSTGKEIINLDVQNTSQEISFSDIINNFKGEGKKAKFYTEIELNKIIEDPKNNIENSDLKQYTPKDLQENLELVEELQEKYNSQKESEKQILEEEINLLENEILEIKSKINSENKSESENKIKNLEIKISKKRLELASQIKSSDTSISTNDLLQFSNKVELIKKLDDLDPEGKDITSSDGRKGLFAGMNIETKDGIYKITGVDWETGKIHLESQGKKGLQKEELTFEGFYQAFKKNKATRINISSLDDLLSQNQEKSEKKDSWSNFIVKNGKLVVKDIPEYSKDKNPEVEYLISDGSNEIFKIEDITGDKITFKWGERKDINGLPEKEQSKYKGNIEYDENGKPKTKDGKIQYKGELLNISKKSETLSLSEFNKLINKNKKDNFYPDWQTGKSVVESNPQDFENNFRGAFMTRLFNNLSLSEVLAGGKMMVENIEEYMKKGNDIHAAQVALKFGKILPEEVQADLLIKVERAESESMDKEIESLGKVDSKIATARIQKWLLNKDTPEFKKEAGMLFMLEKYGSLTVKGPLYPYRGKFLWYEAFGGKIGDKLFLEVKNECDSGGVQFSEEKLMFIFIAKQCKGGYNGISRRSRLYKEFEGKAGAGVTDEIAKGEKDGNQRRNFEKRLEGAFGETESGGDANGLGFYKAAINRGAPLDVMSSYPFAILFSGNGYNMREEVSNEWKNIVGSGFGGLIISRFLSKTDEMAIFNETILNLSYRYCEIDPIKYGNASSSNSIASRAQRIFNNQKSIKLTPNEKMKEAISFWNDYGEALTRTLHYSNDRDDKHIKTDKILILESDSNPVFKNYNELLKGITSGDSDFSNKDMMGDQFKDQGISGLSNKVLDSIGDLAQQGGFRHQEEATGIWNEIINEIGKIKKRYNSGIFTKNESKKLLQKELKVIFHFLLSKNNTNVLRDIDNGTGFLGLPLAKLGLNHRLKEFGEKKINYTDILNGNADEFLNEISNDFLLSSYSGNINLSSEDNAESFKSGIDPVKDETKNRVKNTIPED